MDAGADVLGLEGVDQLLAGQAGRLGAVAEDEEVPSVLAHGVAVGREHHLGEVGEGGEVEARQLAAAAP